MSSVLVRYRELLSQLPAVNYRTVRKLMGHLSIVAGQMEKNLMPVINLAPLWGPNILTVDSQAGGTPDIIVQLNSILFCIFLTGFNWFRMLRLGMPHFAKKLKSFFLSILNFTEANVLFVRKKLKQL